MKQPFLRLGSLLALGIGIAVSAPDKAYAFPFTDLVSFATPEHGYTTVSYAANQSSGFGWEHSVLDNLGGYPLSRVEILDLKAVITYSQTNGSENWVLEGIASLNSASAMTQSEFVLGGNKISDLLVDGVVSLFISETTPGADSFRIYSSKLSGNYQTRPGKATPEIPEPGTLVLFLAGLGIVKFSRLSRAHYIAQS